MEAPLEISETLLWELQFLIMAVFLGLLLRAGYDILIVFRYLVRHKTFWIGVEDVIYCIGGAILTYSLFYNENQGVPRGFALAGIAAGMALYHFGPSRLVCRLMEELLLFLSWPMRAMLKLRKKSVKKC